MRNWFEGFSVLGRRSHEVNRRTLMTTKNQRVALAIVESDLICGILWEASVCVHSINYKIIFWHTSMWIWYPVTHVYKICVRKVQCNIYILHPTSVEPSIYNGDKYFLYLPYNLYGFYHLVRTYNNIIIPRNCLKNGKCFIRMTNGWTEIKFRPCQTSGPSKGHMACLNIIDHLKCETVQSGGGVTV